MKARLWILIGFGLVLGACNQSLEDATETVEDATNLTAEDGVTITAIEPGATSAATIPEGYAATSFSRFVYTATSGKKFLIDFNFFPEGSDFDSQNKTVTIPCEYVLPTSGVDVGLSAPVDQEATDCERDIVVDLSAATFSFLGLEFSYEENVSVFADQFEFFITPTGFTDALDDQPITLAADDATLENVYNLVVDRRL